MAFANQSDCDGVAGASHAAYWILHRDESRVGGECTRNRDHGNDRDAVSDREPKFVDERNVGAGHHQYDPFRWLQFGFATPFAHQRTGGFLSRRLAAIALNSHACTYVL